MGETLKASGIFWWGSEKIPKNHLAPGNAIAGHLEVDSSGLTRLDLIGLLEPHADAFSGQWKKNDRVNKETIHGILSASNGFVVLRRLSRNGANLSNSGLSGQGFVANECLYFQSSKRPLFKDKFTTLTAEITTLDDWFHIQSLHYESRRKGYAIEVRPHPPNEYKLENSTLTVSHLIHPNPKRTANLEFRNINISQSTTLGLKYRKAQNLDTHKDNFSLLEDLLLLLTGLRIQLEWPILTHGKTSCKYFFQRSTDKVLPAQWVDCWLQWADVQPMLGQLFTQLQNGRDSWGPGLYMYLGTRRASRVFLENRFMNFLGGLESLHRKQSNDSPRPHNSLQEKIDRIVNSITLPKDKTWLKQRLKNAAEPSLSERLIELLKELKLPIHDKSLREFCEKCAHLRNDIAHFGGNRDANYEEFIHKLHSAIELIEPLYHALLLLRLGIALEDINNWFIYGPKSYKYIKIFNAHNMPLGVDPI